MKKIILALIAIVTFSFAGNAQNLRANFLKGKSQQQIVETFDKLTTNEKDALWLEKVNQMITQKLPSENLNLLQKVKTFISQKNIEGIKEVASNLGLITPEIDFLKMFESLEDYNYSGKFVGSTRVSDLILIDLKTLGSPSTNQNTGKMHCSCRWCIGMGDVGSNCSGGGGYGCGFLWLQECTHCISCK